MLENCGTIVILLSVMCFVLLVLFILALTNKGGLERMSGKKSRMVSPPNKNANKSQFYGTRSEPDTSLARRPYGEVPEQQNQVDTNLSTLKLSTDDLETPESVEAYDPARLSLEKSVYDSHREFVNDAYISTQGANSTDSLRDDEQNINPRLGLRKVDYTSTYSEADARVVSSESPDQIAQTTGSFVI